MESSAHEDVQKWKRTEHGTPRKRWSQVLHFQACAKVKTFGMGLWRSLLSLARLLYFLLLCSFPFPAWLGGSDSVGATPGELEGNAG